MRFEGKVLFATGGGSGLAAATARRCAAEGGRVAVVDLDRARAEAVAAELDGAVAIACDVADEDSVRSAVATAVDRLGRIDSVFNAAGHVVLGPSRPIRSPSEPDARRPRDPHLPRLPGPCLPCARRLGARSSTSPRWALVALASVRRLSSAKGAILAFSRGFAVDLGPDDIRVDVVAPGFVRTAMTEPVWALRGGGDLGKGRRSGRAAILLRARRGGGWPRQSVFCSPRRQLLHRFAARARRGMTAI